MYKDVAQFQLCFFRDDCCLNDAKEVFGDFFFRDME